MERGWKPSVEISPACPRCGSSSTKFCYYNNYSLTQPRYFCKGCRRYWTKGGSLRNVPIGGGCRKSRRGKSVSSRGTSLSHIGIQSINNSVSPAGPDHASTSNIDLAAVYANFLNPPQNHQIQPLPQLPQGILNIPSIGFSSFQGLHMNRLSCQENHGFFEYGAFPARLPENSMFFGELEGFNRPGNSLVDHCINHNAAVLPPLPGEDDVAASQGILWPDSDIILPHQRAEEAGAHNSELFSAFNLETIFRS